MNYEKIYNNLIAYRKENSFEGYGENHHIILKSLGGSDDISNKVRLTAREHFIAHLLLAKFNRCRQTVFAVYMMKTSSRFHQRSDINSNSRTYKWIREEYSKHKKGSKHSEESCKKMSESGKRRAPASEETRRKLSEIHKGRQKTEAHKLALRKPKRVTYKGVPKSEETKRKIAESLRGKKLSEETKRKIGIASSRQVHTPERRMKVSIANKGRKHTSESRARMSSGRAAKRALALNSKNPC